MPCFPCYRWLNNSCPFSDLTCPFPHNKNGMPLCKNWVEGNCRGGVGNSCRYRHFYTEADETMTNPSQENTNFKPVEYSSPLVQRVERVKERHRRVEIDLETGKRKSFIEETEQEIVDLTGNKENTPVREKRRKSIRLNKSTDDSAKKRKLEQPNQKNTEASDGTCSVCNKTFKGIRGLKSHLSRSNCIYTAEKAAGTKSSPIKTTAPRPLQPINQNDSVICID